MPSYAGQGTMVNPYSAQAEEGAMTIYVRVEIEEAMFADSEVFIATAYWEDFADGRFMADGKTIPEAVSKAVETLTLSGRPDR